MPIARQLVAAVVLLALVLCAWFKPLDEPAARQVDANLKRALISFAAARTLNAVISVAQGTEIVTQPFGVGATFSVGQVLDPVNDLVENFSNLMLAVSVVIGMQKVLLAIGAGWLVSLALSAAALAWCWARWKHARAPAWLGKLLVLLLMLRFAIPVVTLGTEQLWVKFLEPDYAASQQFIGGAAGRIDQLNPPVSAADNPGLLERIKNWVSKNADLKKHFEDIKSAAEQASEHIVKLIAVFVLQTVVIPLLLLWAFYAVLRALAQGSRRGES